MTDDRDRPHDHVDVDVDERVRALAKQLPFDRPDPARRDAVRSSLLVEAAEGTKHAEPVRRRWIVTGAAFASGVLAAAAVAVLLARGAHSDDVELPEAAHITASSEARLDHQLVPTMTGVDEIVRVHAGTIRLATPAPRPGHHIRVRTRDAEVDATSATELEVVVVGETLEAVTVHAGRVELRVTGQRAVMLSAGQTWHAPIITTDLSPSQHSAVPSATDPGTMGADTGTARTTSDTGRPRTDPRIVGTDVRMGTAGPRTGMGPVPGQAVKTAARDVSGVTAETTPTTRTGPQVVAERTATDPETGSSKNQADIQTTSSTSGTDPAPSVTSEAPKPPARRAASELERRFRVGWEMLRRGNAREAAVELAAAADAAPDRPLAADARYFEAVARVRAGDRAGAKRVLVRFLDTAPRSLRRGRAAILLGRLLGERGDVASARAWLESAASDPDPAIAAAARAGLEALRSSR